MKSQLSLSLITSTALLIVGCEQKSAPSSDGDTSSQAKGSSSQAFIPEKTTDASNEASQPTKTDKSSHASSTATSAPTDSNTSFVRPPKAELKKTLTPIQYRVAVESGTEPARANEYWNNKKPGIYVDIISGKALFASNSKFKSGTGWPSFFEPIDKDEVLEVVDTKFGMTRTEVRSKTGDTHLGHLFKDGPQPTGLRYCINSASLRFVPVDKLDEEGLGQYSKLFIKE